MPGVVIEVKNKIVQDQAAIISVVYQLNSKAMFRISEPQTTIDCY